MIDDKNKRNSNLIGVQVFHNYIRPHEGLEGKTPAEACRIELKQEDK
jgi:putative transposase